MNMRSLSFFIIITTLSSTLLWSDQSFKYGKEAAHLASEISQFFPRAENSPNEKKLFKYLDDYFSNLEVEYSTLDYSQMENGHSFSRGYSVKIDGEMEDLLIIAVPLNNPENTSASRDGSISIAIALQLLDIFSKYKPSVSLEFLFLGAERGSEDIYPIGSRHYLDSYIGTISTVGIYLNVLNEGELLTIKNSSKKDLSPMWLIESFAELFMEKDLPFSTENIQALVYQSGFEQASPVMNTFLDKGIPLIKLDSRFDGDLIYDTDRWVNSLIESIMTFVLSSKTGFQREWDRHYYIFKIGGLLITLGEKEGLIIIIALIAFLFTILLFRSRNLHLNIKRFKNHFWTIPLLFFLSFMYLFLSTLIIEEISTIRDFPNLWQQYPGLFLLFKLFTAMLLYSGFTFLIRGLALSPSHHFYTYSAFISVIVCMFTVLLFNINFSYFFFWSLIFISLFMISRKEYVKRLAIILSPLPLVIISYLIFTHPYLKICSFLLTSRIRGNIFLTIIIMPTLMLISSLNYFQHRFHRHRRSYRNIFTLAIWIGLTILTLYRIVNSSPFGVVNRQPVHIDEVIDLDEMSRSILISSPAPLGNVQLDLGDQKLSLNNVGRSAEITAPMIDNLLQISEMKSTFLDRMSLNYSISAMGSPEYINLKLSSPKPLIIFDSNFPSNVTSDGKNIIFYIGKNPIQPLQIRLILPRGSEPDISLSIQYKEFPYNFSLAGKALNPEKNLTIIKNLKWEE